METARLYSNNTFTDRYVRFGNIVTIDGSSSLVHIYYTEFAVRWRFLFLNIRTQLGLSSIVVPFKRENIKYDVGSPPLTLGSVERQASIRWISEDVPRDKI